MGQIQCFSPDLPDSLWPYCPSPGGSIVFVILFGCTSFYHIFQAFSLRKPFAAVLVMGGMWEFVGFIFRTLSVFNQHALGYYTAQALLILLAPLWINAFVYMVLGRMIHFFFEKGHDRLFKFRARRITLTFVLFDITSFIVQAVGGTMASGDQPLDTVNLGLKIYTCGVALQLFFIVIFIVLAARFHQIVLREEKTSYSSATPYTSDGQAGIFLAATVAKNGAASTSNGAYSNENLSTSPTKTTRHAVRLLYVLYAVLALIIARNLYRLTEFASGINSTIAKHEWYVYVFDAVPMFAALGILNLFHPGKTLQGERSDFSQENKEMREKQKAKRALKKAEKQAKRQAVAAELPK